MQEVFSNNLNVYLDLFTNIEYVDSSEDYDKYCQINKDNEKRKALSSFLVNLTKNKNIENEKLVEITCNLMKNVLVLIKEENKTNIVDEIVENVALLYDTALLSSYNVEIDGVQFKNVLKKLSENKPTAYPSLKRKSIFKFMDLAEL
jgi:hypothetical protein